MMLKVENSTDATDAASDKGSESENKVPDTPSNAVNETKPDETATNVVPAVKATKTEADTPAPIVNPARHQAKKGKTLKAAVKSDLPSDEDSRVANQVSSAKTVERVVHRAIDAVFTSAASLRRKAGGMPTVMGSNKRQRGELSPVQVEEDAKLIHRKILDSIYRETYQSGGILDYEECEGATTGGDHSNSGNRNNRKLAANRLAALRCRKRKEMYKTALEQVLFHMTKQVLLSANAGEPFAATNGSSQSDPMLTAAIPNGMQQQQTHAGGEQRQVISTTPMVSSQPVNTFSNINPLSQIGGLNNAGWVGSKLNAPNAAALQLASLQAQLQQTDPTTAFLAQQQQQLNVDSFQGKQQQNPLLAHYLQQQLLSQQLKQGMPGSGGFGGSNSFATNPQDMQQGILRNMQNFGTK